MTSEGQPASTTSPAPQGVGEGLRPPPPRPGSAGGGTGIKVAVGCAAGCGVLMLLAAGVLLFLLYRLVSPGEQAATLDLVGPRSLGVIHLRDSGDESGLGAMIRAFFAELQREANRRQAARMPESMRWLEELQAAQQNTAGLGMFIPSEATLVLDPGVDGRGLQTVAAVNPRAFPRLLRWLVDRLARGGTEVRRSEYHGVEILSFAADSHFAFAGGTILFSPDRELLMRGLDRLAGGAERARSAPAPVLAALPAGRAAAWDAWGSFLDSDGRLGPTLAGILDRLGPAGAASPRPEERRELEATATDPGHPLVAESFTFGVDVLSDDHLRLDLEVDAPSASAADLWLSRLRRTAAEVAARPSWSDLETTFSGRVEGGRALAEVDVDGVRLLLATGARFLLAEAEAGRPGREPEARP